MIEPYQADKEFGFPDRFLRWLELFRAAHNTIPKQTEGDGSPEGVVFAAEQSRYYNRTGAAATLLYVKTTGSQVNTGWVAYG